MQTSDVCIVVDVKQVLGRESGDELISVLGQVRGVSGAWLSPATRRLVLVDYDPKQTDAQRILGTVVHRGFDARLIGM